jgi:phosphatidylinositol alpha-1,6-mannosyltransferase
VSDSVIFTGSVPWDEVPAYADAGDVFAMPCRTRWFGLEPEAFGIVFLEAGACGLPVLAGDSGGASESISAVGSMVIRSAPQPVARGLVRLLAADRSDRLLRPFTRDSTWDASAQILARHLIGWGR